MPDLFHEARIRSMRLPNRFVRSATWEGLATPEGACTERLLGVIDLLLRCAPNGVSSQVSLHERCHGRRKEGRRCRAQPT